MKKTLVYLIFTFFCFSNIFAQEISDNIFKQKKHGIGLALTSTAGYGLSYTYFPEKIGFKTTSFFYVQEDFVILDIGGMLKYELYTYQNYKAYSFLSAQYSYTKDNYNSGFNPFYEVRNHVNAGLGVGLDVYLEHFILHGHLGFGAYRNFERITMLNGGIGAYFRF